jgi:hypothetical protein
MVLRYFDQTSNRFAVTHSAGAANSFSEDAEFSVDRPFNVSISGTWAGTVTLQRSFNGGSTWLDVASYTANAELSVDTVEASVLWRIGIKSGNYTSGAAVLRLSQ